MLFRNNWSVSNTSPLRYSDLNVIGLVQEYVKDSGRRFLTIVDFGCSKGEALRVLSDELAELGVGSYTVGVDLNARVAKYCVKNVDEFRLGNVFDIGVDELPLADVVICCNVVLWMSAYQRYWMMLRCAQQLNRDGMLVANATPHWKLKWQIPLMPLAECVAVRGRIQAFRYADHIRTDYDALDPVRRQVKSLYLWSSRRLYSVLGLLGFEFCEVRDFVENYLSSVPELARVR